MADSDNSGEAAKPAENAAGKSGKSELPNVESPPLSPAGEVEEPAPAASTSLILATPIEERISARPAPSRLRIKPRHKRQAVLAASVALAAGIGAVIGALAAGGKASPVDTAALQQRQAMAQSIAKLDKELTTLKASVEVGSKSARTQIAKIGERLNHPPAAEPATTGSIPTPPASVPTPPPRPAPRATVLHDWRIFDVRNGRVAVAGHGEIYEIGIGAPLPGLGPVQEIKRENGRWFVVTPRGMIVSQRDRRYFETD